MDLAVQEQLNGQTQRVKKGIPGSTLKWIAIIAMLIDHTGAILLESQIMKEGTLEIEAIFVIDFIMRLIGRFGFPIFAFLLVEGFTHTRSVKKYALNLSLFALISELPFNLGFSGTLFYPGYQNVFFTLAIAVVTLTGVQYVEEHLLEKNNPILYWISCFVAGVIGSYLFIGSQFGMFFLSLNVQSLAYWLLLALGGIVGLIICAIVSRKWNQEKKNVFTYVVYPILAGLVVADLLKTDYAAWGVFTVLVIYYYRHKKVKAMAMGCLSLSIMSLMEVTAFFMLIPVSKYNGKRGMNLKYFFYAFYPVHITLLYLLALACGYVSFAIR